MPTTIIDGIATRYEVLGSGPPLLIYAPGARRRCENEYFMTRSQPMPKTSGQSKTVTSGCGLLFALATFLALALGASSPVRAQPYACPGHDKAYPEDKAICTMTIKIFNDDPDHFIYPVLTTGRGAKDIWMQAWFSVKTKDLDKNPYPRKKNYRLYINPTHGIPPHTGISLTLPLFTQLDDPIIPNPGSGQDTFIDWWNGGTIQLYTSPGTAQAPAAQPPSLTDALGRPQQKPVEVNFAGASKPTCEVANSPQKKCEALTIYSDVGDLPKEDGSQLLEYTLGARNLPSLKNKEDGIAEALDTTNVDFDVSYVNLVWAPAAMGVYKNDQVGYVGTPQTIDDFQKALMNFKNAPASKDWPQFVKIYTNIKPTNPPPTTNLKFPSPLEIFAVLTGANPPTNLTPVPDPKTWPSSLWKPIADLRSDWIKYAGTVTAISSPPYYRGTDGACGAMPAPGAPVTKWCNAIVAVKAILLRNYTNYQSIFSSKCKKTPDDKPVDISDKLLIAHAYGWGPWTEGCAADANLLQDTPGQNGDPGYFETIEVDGKSIRDYTKYLTVKLGFDKLNYGKLSDPGYTFNPWVDLIHTKLDITCGYAYSVDDALGNVQAEGQGFIVDVGSTEHLENHHECSPPINITLGYGANDPTRFEKYAVCKKDNVKQVNSAFPSFIINSADPAGCPIYLWDNGVKVDDEGKVKVNDKGEPIKDPQLYTFTVGVTPDKFPVYEKYPDQPTPKWTAANAAAPGSTAAPIVCTGNTSSSPFQQSSAIWCCDKASSSGVFAYAAPDAASAHRSTIYNVITRPAEKCKVRDSNQPVDSGCRVNVQFCSQGK
jgi:hypothetical protein